MMNCRTPLHHMLSGQRHLAQGPPRLGSNIALRLSTPKLRATADKNRPSNKGPGGGSSGGGGSSRGRGSKPQPDADSEPEGGRGGLSPSLELAVPVDQRPVSQLAELKNDMLYSWAVLDTSVYIQRLVLVYASFFAFIGGPIAYQTFDPFVQPIEWWLSGSVGSLLVVAVLSLRTYLGWQYLGDRLMRAAIDYEETGWYDGQVFVKPPEVLMRDRLLGTYEVKPTVRKLQATLLGTGGGLLVCSIALSVLINAGSDADGMYGRSMGRPTPRMITSSGPIYSKNVSDLEQLRYDDNLASEEAAAAGGRPGYCADRVLRAAAGGQYCAEFD